MTVLLRLALKLLYASLRVVKALSSISHRLIAMRPAASSGTTGAVGISSCKVWTAVLYSVVN